MKQTPVILLLVLLLYTMNTSAQFYLTGEPPSSLKWRKIYTDHYNVIYPVSLDSQANIMANLLESYYPFAFQDYPLGMNRKIPVILQNESQISNGFVSLAPERMELVTTPPVESYGQDWLSQLALHESRHVAQLNFLNRGATKGFGYLTGEISRGIVSAMIPAWLFEGDAVYAETKYSNAGRGRIAGFLMPLRALIVEKSPVYSYDKAIFGSYKDYVPDQYQYGYVMTEFGINTYGTKLWSRGLKQVANYPFTIWPLSFFLKKNTGVSKPGLYKQTIDSLKSQYNSEIQLSNYTSYSCIFNRPDRVYTSYVHAHEVEKGIVLALSQGLNDAGSIVQIKDSTVEKIASTGRTISARLDCSDSYAIWDEIVFDPRWEQRSFSVVKMLNLETKKVKNLTRKTRYFSPAFSDDGKSIAVVEVSPSGKHSLVLLNASNGQAIKKFDAPGREIKYPVWLNDSAIAVISVYSNDKTIESVNTHYGNWTRVLLTSEIEIGDLSVYKNYIIFRSKGDGTDNLFALDRNAGSLCYQLTASKHGAYYPSVGNDYASILFSEYSEEGFNIVKTSIDSLKWTRIQPDSICKRNEQNRQGPQAIPFHKYESIQFNKALDVFRIHSWLPFYANLSEVADGDYDLNILPGLTLLSQNKLGTIISSLGYNFSNGYHRIRPSLSIRSFYPVFEISGMVGGPRMSLPLPEGITPPENPDPYYEISVSTYIPLRFQMNSNTIRIRPEIEFERSSIWYYEDEKLKDGWSFVHYKLNASIYSRMSLRNLYPRWGQSVLFTVTNSPWRKTIFGAYYSFTGTSYLPGLFTNHHVFLKYGYQLQLPQRYYLPLNRIGLPRGYSNTVSEEMMMVSLNYAFTVANPDFAMGPAFYIKRLNLNLFYDYAYGSAVSSPGNFNLYGYVRSVGFEAWSDMHVARFILPISAGVRMGYMIEENHAFTELLLSINTGIF